MSMTKNDLELEKLREELRKAKAEADDAEIAAAKNRREEAESASPAAVARREAVAEKEAADARRSQVASLIPDFSKVERGDLKLEKEGQPTAGTGVAGRAVKAAAKAVKDEMVGARTNANETWRLLVTSDTQLAVSDAAYWDAVTGLDRLTSLATQVLTSTEAGEVDKEVPKPEALPLLALGVIAQAVPGILSLIRTNRTVTTGEVSVDDLTASAAVASEMKGENSQRTVYHDAFRVLPKGEVHDKVETLRDRRQELIQRKLELESKAAPAADTDAAADLKASIALVASVGDGIDEFLKTLTAVPESGTTSPFAAAALRQGLHDDTFTHVLLVKSQSASAMQVVNDKAFGDDTVAVLAAATITWILIETSEGQVLDAGVSSGTAQATGKIGKVFSFDEPGTVSRR